MKHSIKKLEPYKVSSQKIYSLKNKTSALKANWNESIYPTCPEVKKAIINYLESDCAQLNWYANVDNLELKKMLANHYEVDTSQFNFYPGSDSCLTNIARCVIDQKEKAIIFSPTYDQFRVELSVEGANIISVYVDDQFQISKDFIVNFLNENLDTKLVYLCNPNNPTGWQIKSRDIEKICKTFKDTFFIIDEAYIEFCDDVSSHTSLQLIKKLDNIFVVRTFSKAYALAGMRFGLVFSSNKNIEMLNKFRNTKCINILTEVAVIATLNNIDYYENLIEKTKKSRNSIVEELSYFYECINTECNFFLLRVENSNDLLSFLEKENIFIRDLSHLPGLKNYVRITCGPKDLMKKMLVLLKEYKKKIVVIDIDNTVADQYALIKEESSKNKKFNFKNITEDKLQKMKCIEGAVKSVTRISKTYKIIWLTARPEKERAVTRRWLEKNNFPVDGLILTGKRDLKLEVLKNLRPYLFIDDMKYDWINHDPKLTTRFIQSLKDNDINYLIFNTWKEVLEKLDNENKE